MRVPQMMRWLILGGCCAVLGPVVEAQAEIVMKVLIVNPSETEVKEFTIRSPLPPEVKAEHVLDTDGLKVDYDAQAGAYFLIGSITLKPKEALTKRILLEDVWVIPKARFDGLRSETEEMLQKLTGSQYQEQGRLLAGSVKRRLTEIQERQDQPFLNPQQHINGYREDLKALQMVDSDLVSLRQLMVMAALNPSSEAPIVVAGAGSGTTDKGSLSLLTTWRLIFMILAVLGGISLSFFFVWQRQLKQQLAKQATQDAAAPADEGLFTNGNGQHAANTTTPPRSVAPPLPPSPVKS